MSIQTNWETQIIQEQKTLPKSYNKLMIIDREPQSVHNPFSGESCELTPVAVAVYDMIKGCEVTLASGEYLGESYQYWQDMFYDGIHWFQKHYSQEYMTLLD